MQSLASPAFRAKLGENGNFILMHSVCSIPHGNQTISASFSSLNKTPNIDGLAKQDLKERLLKWMEQQGDKGQQTEMEALEHQTKGQKD